MLIFYSCFNFVYHQDLVNWTKWPHSGMKSDPTMMSNTTCQSKGRLMIFIRSRQISCSKCSCKVAVVLCRISFGNSNAGIRRAVRTLKLTFWPGTSFHNYHNWASI